MSRAFVKEVDGVEEALLQRPVSERPNYVTAKGLAALKARVDELLDRKLALEGHEDLSAKQQLQSLERDLHYVVERVETAILVNAKAQIKDEVHFGAAITVADAKGQKQTFVIVGEDEADIAAGKIGWTSPLAEALIGGRVGDVVIWKRPTGDAELEILAIVYPDAEAS